MNRKKHTSSSFRGGWWYILLIVILFFVLSMYYIINMLYATSIGNDLKSCLSDRGRSLYSLRTKLGVTYDGSHWFHIAENFMTQHSVLRKSSLQSCSHEIYYNFDKAGFVTKLNGVTKLMIVLATFRLPTDTAECKDNHHFKFYFVHLVDSLQKHKAISFSSSNQNVLVENDNINELVLETIAPNIPIEKRFILKQTHSNSVNAQITATAASVTTRSLQNDVLFLRNSVNVSSLSNDICAKNMGTIGGVWPTVQRGHWFPNEGDVDSFRKKLAYLCPGDKGILEKNRKKGTYKLAIYQRDLSRKLLYQVQAIELLRSRLPLGEWEIVVIMHKKDRSPCEMTHLLNNVDVLLTPHGFQSMLLLFMRRPSVLFEVFPYRYYKRAYGPLSHEYGIIHGGTMSPSLSWWNYFWLSSIRTKWCMDSKYCRGFARNSDVTLTTGGVNQLMEVVNKYLETIKTTHSFEDKLYA